MADSLEMTEPLEMADPRLPKPEPFQSDARPIPFPPEQSNFLRSLVRYRGDPLARFDDMKATCPPVAGWRIFGREFVLVRDPVAIEEILVTKHALFKKDTFTTELSVFLGEGLLTSYGPKHREQRRHVATPLSAPEVARYAPSMTTRALHAVRKWSDGSVIDVTQTMMTLTLDVLVDCLFGADFVDHNRVEHALSAALPAFLPWPALFRMVLPEWVPLRSRAALIEARAELVGVVDRLIEARRDGNGDDLLSRLLVGARAGHISVGEVRDQVGTLLLAGHETTALTLGYALKLLHENPRWRQRIESEVDELFASGAVQADGLRGLTVMHAVLKETLRLFPPAWLIGREALEDCTIARYKVPSGTQLLIPIITQHRDARWFDEPLSFRPERFLEGNKAGHDGRSRLIYAPFGGGPRVCVGNHFAMLEAAAILAAVVHEVRLDTPPGTRFDLLPAVTLRPKYPMPMRVTRRRPGLD